MKRMYAVLVVFLIALRGIMAQDARPVEITEDTMSVGRGSVPALSVVIPEVDYEKTMKNWIKTLESGTKSKVVTSSNDMSIFGAKIKPVSDNPVNVYSMLNNQSEGVNLKVAIEPSKDNYIQQTSPEYSKAREFLLGFARDQYMDVVSSQVKDEESKLKSLERELSSLEREQQRFEKASREGDQTIAAEKNRLAVLNNQLESVSGTIVDDSSQPAGMGTADAKKDYVKDLEKQNKKTQKEIEASQKKISKAQDDIAEASRELPKIAGEQDQLRSQIDQQEAVVKKFRDKLDTIKSYK